MTDPAKVYSVQTVDAALNILDGEKDVRILAGGTDLMVLLNARQFRAPAFLDIWKVNELRGIRDEGAWLRIGALTSFSEIINSRLTRTWTPLLVEAALTIGAVQIQNRGTLGGNLVNGSPAGDSLPVLAVLDAEIDIASQSRGTRTVGYQDFYTAYRRTVLEADEIVTSIKVRKLEPGEKGFFYKVGTRRAQAISKVMMAARLAMNNGSIDSCAISYGSMTPVVRRAGRVEAALRGWVSGSALPDSIQNLLEGELSPIDDIRSTARYRMRVARNLLARMLREVER